MARKRKTTDEPALLSSVLEELPIVQEIKAEKTPPTGPRGKWTDGYAKNIVVGNGSIHFHARDSRCVIRFDDSCAPYPGTEYGQRIKDWFVEQSFNGKQFKYDVQSKGWVMFKGDQPQQTTLHAMEVFGRLGDMLRQQNKLPPMEFYQSSL